MYNVVMSGLSFEWDIKKNTSNEKKHGISFDEDKTVLQINSLG